MTTTTPSKFDEGMKDNMVREIGRTTSYISLNRVIVEIIVV